MELWRRRRKERERDMKFGFGTEMGEIPYKIYSKKIQRLKLKHLAKSDLLTPSARADLKSVWADQYREGL